MNKRFKRQQRPQLLTQNHDGAGQRCIHCHQTQFETITAIGEKFHDEVQVLTHPDIRPIASESSVLTDHIPQFRVQRYYVTDESDHAVALDSGLIESGVALYLSGHVIDVTREENNESNAIPAGRIGPLIEWWFSGFDNSDQIIIGAETELASYILVKADPAYNKFVNHLLEKIFLCKLVIEILTDSPDAAFGELIESVRTRSRCLFNSETLLVHSGFVIQQVKSYDEAGSEQDIRIADTNAFRELIDFYGTPENTENTITRKDSRRLANSDTSAVTTPLVSEFFRQIQLPITGSRAENPKIAKSSHPNTRRSSACPRWSGAAVCSDVESGRTYYSCLKIGCQDYRVDDFVILREDKKDVIGQIRWMYERSDKHKLIHVLKFMCGRETILGSAAQDKQLFAINECRDMSACHLRQVISVITNEASLVISKDSAERGDYFCYHSYFRATGTFTCFRGDERSTCSGCLSSHALHPEPELVIGDFVCIRADLCDREDFLQAYFHQSSLTTSTREQEEGDDALYPERYRKAYSDGLKWSFAHLLPLLTIARIEAVLHDERVSVRLFYRAHNISTDYEFITRTDIREIFSSDSILEIYRKDILKKCSVHNGLPHSTHGRETDFFTHRMFNRETSAIEPANLCIDEGVRDTRLQPGTKYKTLDLFSGCGGLALGFKQSNLIETRWAIEKDESAARSFSTNFPETTVFTDDVNSIMRGILSGVKTDKHGRRYPTKGEVDMILAGPPCQGFSEMNRFSSGTYSLFKNSLIATSLSFIDYYRPQFVYLENVRNFMKFGESMIFKMTLSCLVRMGYQVRFMLLQAGFYGLPQARSRLFIVAAAPDCPLPDVPTACYSFPARYFTESVIIDECRYFLGNLKHFLYRPMTVRDAIADLPLLAGTGDPDEAVAYATNASSTFQEHLRSDAVSVRDHVSRKLSPLNFVRVQMIPRERGADWRDLPNMEFQSGDVRAKKLEYRYPNRSGETGRGVCPCGSGSRAKDNNNVRRTLSSPGGLVHTAHRNYHWSGLYGRIHWDELFSTTVTIPEPSSKQGRVIHPESDRVLSVRECARSQGFPDHFVFKGSISDRYRQIGNAVAVQVSAALAQALLKSTVAKDHCHCHSLLANHSHSRDQSSSQP